MGPYHLALITKSGDLYTFGSGSYGKLGHGSTSDQLEPTLVEFFSKQKLKIKDVVCGKYQTLILDQEGSLWACGYGGNQFTMCTFSIRNRSCGIRHSRQCDRALASPNRCQSTVNQHGRIILYYFSRYLII